MNKKLLFLAIVLIFSIGQATADNPKNDAVNRQEDPGDSTRIAELDRYWAELSRTVREGDFEGMGAVYHPDAVIVFAAGEHKTSVPISSALEGWKQGLLDTKQGKVASNVEFRFPKG